jgi:hypothetical protein
MSGDEIVSTLLFDLKQLSEIAMIDLNHAYGLKPPNAPTDGHPEFLSQKLFGI